MKPFTLKISALVMAVTLIFLCFGCAEEEEGSKRGAVTGNTYHSDYTNLTFEKTDTMTYYGEEVIASMSGLEAKEISFKNFNETLRKSEKVYDMYAVDPSNGATVEVGYENSMLTYGYELSPEEYLLLLHTSMGEFRISEVYTVALSGIDYSAVDAEATVNGIKIFRTLCAREKDDLMSFVTVTCEDEEQKDEYIAMFLDL